MHFFLYTHTLIHVNIINSGLYRYTDRVWTSVCGHFETTTKKIQMYF